MSGVVKLFFEHLYEIVFNNSDEISKIILKIHIPDDNQRNKPEIIDIYKNNVRKFLVYNERYFCDDDNYILGILDNQAKKLKYEILEKYRLNKYERDYLNKAINMELSYLNKVSEIMISRFLSSEKQCEIIQEQLHEIQLCRYFIDALILGENPNYQVFVDFNLLPKILCKISLKPKEKFEIIIYFLRISKKDIIKTFDKEDISTITKALNTGINTENFIKNYNILSEYYNKDNDNLKKEDIEKIKEALIELGIDKKLSYNIYSDFLKKINQKKYSDKVSTISYEIEKDRKLKEQERYNMIKELENYFDFRNMKCIRFLSMSEVLYVISILKKLKYDDETIRNFIIINEYQLNMSNPITRYVQLYDKLKYYVEKYGLLDEFKELNDYFNELFISDDNDYSFYKSCLDKQLDYILSLIPRNYDYELRNTK